MIDWQSTVDALESALANTDPHFVLYGAGGATPRTASLDPELADAAELLADLRAAASAYANANAAWSASYERAFRLLDRRSRHALAMTTPVPSSLPFATDDDTHDALVARADAAAGSVAPSTSLTDLAVYRAAFDTSWSAKPSDAGPEGVALAAALERAKATTVFLLWSRDDAS